MSGGTVGQARVQEAEQELVSAFADLRCGILLADAGQAPADPRLERLAAAAPELFANDRVCWELVFGRLASADQDAFQHVVLVSCELVHIAMRCSQDPSVALIAVAPRNRSVGSIVAEARGRLSRRVIQRV